MAGIGSNIGKEGSRGAFGVGQGPFAAMIGVGLGVAALVLIERQTRLGQRSLSGVRRHGEEIGEFASDRLRQFGDSAHRSVEETRNYAGKRARRATKHGAESAAELGAKLAGLAALLKTVGGGTWSTGARRAAELWAAKKLGEVAKNHPLGSAGFTAGAAAVGKKLSDLGEEIGRRGSAAFNDLRHGPRPAEHKGSATGESLVGMLAVLGVGAAAALLFDPRTGAARRNYLRDQATGLFNDLSDTLSGKAKDFAQRAQGTFYEMSKQLREAAGQHEEVDDETLRERVRAGIGHVEHVDASLIGVEVDSGSVTLTGTVPHGEVDNVVGVVEKIAGVRHVESRLEEQPE